MEPRYAAGMPAPCVDKPSTNVTDILKHFQ